MKKSDREIILLVGLPASGKTSFIENNKCKFADYTVISVDKIIDDFIQDRSEYKNSTADYIYINHKAEVDEEFYRQLKKAIDSGDNIIIDRSNSTHSIRSKIINFAKSAEDYNYSSKAVLMSPSEDEHCHRLFNRMKHHDRTATTSTSNLQNIEPIQKGEFEHIEYVGEKTEKPLFWEYQKPKKPLSEYIKDANNLGSGEWRR